MAAPKTPNTAPGAAATRRKKLDRWAEGLVAAGFQVIPPDSTTRSEDHPLTVEFHPTGDGWVPDRGDGGATPRWYSHPGAQARIHELTRRGIPARIVST